MFSKQIVIPASVWAATDYNAWWAPHQFVRAWQARMKQRGWDIKADGRFGPRSAKVAARFAAEKGIQVKAGTVDHTMWNAAWALPVT